MLNTFAHSGIDAAKSMTEAYFIWAAKRRSRRELKGLIAVFIGKGS